MRLIAIFLFISVSVFAQDQVVINRVLINRYYVSAAGSGDGTSASPMSFSALQALMPTIPNYSEVYLNAGDLFEGSLEVSRRITIDKYGTGENPVISGSVDISAQSWTDNGSNIFYTTMSGLAPRAVFVLDVEQPKAETEYINITARTAHNAVSSTVAGLDAINAVQSIVGAEIVAKQFAFQPTRRDTVASFDGTIVGLNNNFGLYNATLGSYAPNTNMAFKLMNHLNFINTVGEWCYDAATQRLYIMTSGSAPTDIFVSNEDYGINLINGIDYVTIKNVDFKHQYLASINSVHNNYLTIDSCKFSDGHYDAISLWGNSRNVVIRYDTITKYCGSGIRMGGIKNSTISRNYITQIGMQTWLCPIEYPSIAPVWREYERGVGVGINSFFDAGAEEATQQNNTISYNLVRNTGYSNIVFWGSGITVSNNIAEHSCERWNDGAGIYSVWRPNGFSYGSFNCTIENNIVRDHRGSATSIEGVTGAVLAVIGIYADNATRDFVIDNNTVDNCESFSILINYDTKNHTITNNKIRGAPVALRQFISAYTNNLQRVVSTYPYSIGHTFEGNEIGNTFNSLYCVQVRDHDGITTYNPFSGGNSDTNHYVNPYTANIGQYDGGGTTLYGLSGWQTRFSDDAASTERVNYITYSNETNAYIEVEMETNDTEAAVNFNVPAGYTDYSGAAFSNPVTIQPFESLLYYKDTAAP